jgi:Xaa-Pro aminopeptidase
MSALEELVTENTPVWISKAPHVTLSGCHDRAFPADRAAAKDPLDGRVSREEALARNLTEKFECEVKDFTPILSEIRRVKTPEEIDAMRRAGRAGSAAMAEAIRSTQPGQGEWQIEALMSFVHRREGAEGPAYHGIVGSGPNALVLHYSSVSREMQAGEMLLIDYAPEYDHYASDITRSWPTDGKFTQRMAEIYDAVLEAQEAGIAAVAPGKTMREIDKVCRKVLQSRGMGKLMPHGACHYIGMEVHDVGEFDKPFEPGVSFTIEPGVYDPASGIGVRIEDVVVVTETGCEVITSDVPKAREAIVALWNEEGILERAPATRVRAIETPTSVESPKR